MSSKKKYTIQKKQEGKILCPLFPFNLTCGSLVFPNLSLGGLCPGAGIEAASAEH